MSRSTSSSQPRRYVLAAAALWCALVALQPGAATADRVPTNAPATQLPGAVASLPSAGELQTRIKAAESSTDLSEATKSALLDAYKQALANLESAAKLDTKGAGFARALEEAPAQTATIRKQLTSGTLERGPADLEASPGLSAEELGQRLVKAQSAAAFQENRIAELDKLIESGSGRTKEARTQISELRQSIDRIESDQRQTPASDQPADLTQAKSWALAAKRQALLAEIRTLEQELASQGVRDELYRAQRDQATLGLRGIKARMTDLEEQQAARRKADAQQAQDAAEAAKRDAAGKHPLVQKALQDNTEVGTALNARAEQLASFADALDRIERERKRVEEDYRGARERIEAAGLNQALGQILIDRRSQLPDRRQYRRETASRDERIAEASLRQIRYREEENHLRNIDEAVDAIVATDSAAQSPEVRAQLKEALVQRKSLLHKAAAAEEDYIRKLVQLNSATDQLISVANVFDTFLAENLLWVRSALPVGLETLTALPGAFATLASRSGWKEVAEVLLYEARHSMSSWLGVLAVAGSFWASRRLRRAILDTAEPLRRVRSDRFRYTLRAMGLTLLAAVPYPLLCLVVGRDLANSAEATQFTRAIGSALVQVSVGFYYLRAFRIMCMPGGLADRHFRWESAVLVQIRANLRWFTPFIVPVSTLAIAIYQLNEPANSASLGRITLIAAMCGFAVLFARLFNPRTGVFKQPLEKSPNSWVNRSRNLWYAVVLGTPLALAGLALMGYLYTAGTLFQSLVASAWLALGLVVFHQAIVRWLVVTRRRLALQAALDRQAARRAQAESGGTVDTSASVVAVDEPEIDWASLDEQTRKLINAVVVFSSFFGIWLIWADMLPAFNILDQFALWHYERTVDGVAQSVPMTVADAILVLAILVIGAVAAKNLPALLEIVLLQATSVSAGTRYAVRTLVRYAISIAVVLGAFGALGLSWSQVQWLVAALGVGIGFGLQEIVANFISGIIILFERPVRVGDVVTIGGTTGAVTNIQIRATTIRNWDRQELLVPNKELITGRLLNWTLSDQINRVVIPVGIEYGSNPEVALRLLARAAEENARVLKEPAPTVAFEGFGDNSLTLMLRCYLDSLEQRPAVTTELYLAIERLFREHEVQIAFPQRDIRLTAREPLDIRLRRDPRAASQKDGYGQSGDEIPDGVRD